MPLGGIGAGCICLNGYGALQDFSIRNHPDNSALPDRHASADAAFALLHIKGVSTVTRLIEGPIPAEKIYAQGLKAQGFRQGGYEGLPRFRTARLTSGFPFAQVELSDPAVPLEVKLVGWSPFIPLDDVASGLPCAILEYSFRNKSRKPVEFEFSYHLSHFPGQGTNGAATRNEVIPGKGVFFSTVEPPAAAAHASASLTVIGHRPVVKAMWLRGGWFDPISALWREVETGRFVRNDGQEDAGKEGQNGGSLLVKASLAPGGQVTIPVVITWHFPNSNLMTGQPAVSGCCGGEGCCESPKWRPFYASQWKDAREVAALIDRQYPEMREKTIAFQRALLESTYPTEVLDAISANLAILKSPTMLRQENGNVWGWEGCFPDSGCCPGSCTHVWNYAQALPHLFPRLERTLREQELQRSMDAAGHVNFRAALPDGPPAHDYHPAADGQLGGIMKVYRDWQISGDGEWLKTLYPLAKQSLDYCIQRWDPERKGALIEPHHNTYEIEFWGPDGMCTSIYIGALSALAAMAAALGREDDRKTYEALARKSAAYIDKNLFNGEYFEQRVQFKGLRDTSFVDLVSGRKKSGDSNGLMRLLKKEGPRYQYGTGCLSDGVIGAWMALIYGIDTPMDRDKIRTNLRAIHRHNFRRSLLEHANPQRPGYALGDEPGLLLCTWPRGGKPTLPFVYSDEVWTGIEYQVASHLIAEDFVREGLEIVKAVRSRYAGRTRNPWNEYECGSYYARAMASFALLGALSGFRYSAVEQTLWFGPKIEARPFTTFFSCASGYGSISLGQGSLTISILEGEVKLGRIVLTLGGKVLDLTVGQTAAPGRPVTFAVAERVSRKGAKGAKKRR